MTSAREMGPPLEPFTEPWQSTALRTGGLALLIGVVAGLLARRPATIPVTALIALWFTLGGHFLELLFRNRLRRHLGNAVLPAVLARLLFWFAGGGILFRGALATRGLLTGRDDVPVSGWMVAGGFVVAELLIHLSMQLRGLASVYNGRG